MPNNPLDQYAELGTQLGRMNLQQHKMTPEEKDLFNQVKTAYPQMKPVPDHKAAAKLFRANEFKDDIERKATIDAYAELLNGKRSSDPVADMAGGLGKVPKDINALTELFAGIAETRGGGENTLFEADPEKVTAAVEKKAAEMERADSIEAPVFPSVGGSLATTPIKAKKTKEEYLAAAREKLYKDDRPLQLDFILKQLTPASRRVAQIGPFMEDHLTVEAALRSVAPSERGLVVQAIQLSNPAKMNLWGRVVDRNWQEHGNMMRLSERRMDAVYDALTSESGPTAGRTLGWLQQAFGSDMTLPDGSPIFDGADYASEEARVAVENLVQTKQAEIFSQLKQESAAFGYSGYTAAANQKPLSEKYLSELPADVATHQGFLEAQNIQRQAEQALAPRLPDDVSLGYEMLATSADLLPMMLKIAGAATVAGPLAGFAMSYGLQEDAIYGRYIEAGMDPLKAGRIAGLNTAAIAALDTIGNRFVFKLSSGRTLADTVKHRYLRASWRVAWTKTLDVGVEGATESTQQALEALPLLILDEVLDIEGITGTQFGDEVREAFIMTMKGMPGIAMGPAAVDLSSIAIHKISGGAKSLGLPGAQLDMEAAYQAYLKRHKEVQENQEFTEDENGNVVVVVPQGRSHTGEQAPVVPFETYASYKEAKADLDRALESEDEAAIAEAEARMEDVVRSAEFEEGSGELQLRLDAIEELEQELAVETQKKLARAYNQTIGAYFQERNAKVAQSINDRLDDGETVDSVLTSMLKKLDPKGNARVVVVNNPMEILDLPGASPQLKRDIVSGEHVEGVIDRGTVYLIKQNLTSPALAVMKLAHEYLGHRGLDSFSKGVANDIKDSVAAELARRGLLTPFASMLMSTSEVYKRVFEEGANVRAIADEYIARMAEELIDGKTLEAKKRGFWGQIVADIGERLGLETAQEWSERSMAELVLEVMRGGNQGVDENGAPKYSSGRNLSGAIGTGLGYTDFFGGFHEAKGDEWFFPHGEYESAIPLGETADDFQRTRGKYMGNFDMHIATSIPGFSDLQAIVGDALVKAYGEQGARILDIGASEGALAKALAEKTEGRISTIALDPNPKMKATFDQTAQVEGAEYRLEALGTPDQYGQPAWTAKTGEEIVFFDPGEEKFDVVHEAMVFQFLSNQRASQIALVKSMMAEDGVAVFEEKFAQGDINVYNLNEISKDLFWKSKYYTQEQIERKRKEVLQAGGDSIEGMTKMQVTVEEMHEVLSKNFKHFAQFWDSGNFMGFIASDSEASLQRILSNMQDTSSEFSSNPTGEILSKTRYSVSDVRKAQAIHELQVLGVPLRTDGRVQLTHWSPVTGLTSLEPESFGTGPVFGRERERAGGGFVNRVQFGLAGYQREVDPGHRYHATVDPEVLYPLLRDPLGLREQARPEIGQKGDGTPIMGSGVDLNRYEQLIQENGYKGFISTANYGPVVAMFEAVPVDSVVENDTTSYAPVQVGLDGQDELRSWNYLQNLRYMGGLIFRRAGSPTGMENNNLPRYSVGQKVFYHGSPYVLDKFLEGRVPGISGFFTISPAHAGVYASADRIEDLEEEEDVVAPNITPVTLSVNNPADFSPLQKDREATEEPVAIEQLFGVLPDGGLTEEERNLLEGDGYAKGEQAPWEWIINDAHGVIPSILKARGYDGIRQLETNYRGLPRGEYEQVETLAVFSSDQISSLYSPTHRYSVMPRPVDALGFYSPIRAEIETMDFNQIPPKQLADRIRKLPKQEEMEDIGLYDWLELQEGKVAKADVLAFIDQGGVVLNQIVNSESEAEANTPEFSFGNEIQDQHDEDFIREVIEGEGLEVYLARVEPDVLRELEGGDIDRDTAMEAAIAWEESFRSEDLGYSRDVEVTVGDKTYNFSWVWSPFDGHELYSKDFQEDVIDGQFQQGFMDNPQVEQMLRSYLEEKDIIGDEEANEPQYGSYVMEGPQSNYREFILTLPPVAPDPVITELPPGYEVKEARIAEEWGWNVVTPAGEILGADRVKENAVKIALSRLNEERGITGIRMRDRLGQSDTFSHQHWSGINNPLVHFRTTDRKVDGKDSLFLEEIQSDWIQQGRKKGFKRDLTEKEEQRLEEIDKQLATYNAQRIAVEQEVESLDQPGGKRDPERRAKLVAEGKALLNASRLLFDEERAIRAQTESGVPDPGAFKRSGTVDLLAFKRALAIAVEEGKDSISWTPAIEQIRRWSNSLQQEVRSIGWEAFEDEGLPDAVGSVDIQDARGGTSTIYHDAEGTVVSVEGALDRQTMELQGESLANIFDNSIAKQILEQESGMLEGEGLSIGGKGFKDFYDGVLPRSVQKYVKKMGGRVGVGKPLTKDLPRNTTEALRYQQRSEEVWNVEITDQMRDEVSQGQPRYSIRNGQGDPGSVLENVEINDEKWDITSDTRYSINPLFGVEEPDRLWRRELSGAPKYLFASNRVRVGTYTGIDPLSGIEIELQGGPGYAFNSGAGWAVNDAAMAKRLTDKEGYGLITLFGPENTMGDLVFAKAYVAEIKHALSNGTLSKTAFLRVANQLRVAAKRRKDQKGTPIVRGAWADLWRLNWKTVEEFEMALLASTPDVRRAAFFGWSPKPKKRSDNRGAIIGRDDLVTAGFPNLTKIVELINDPAFESLSSGMVIGAVDFTGKYGHADELGVKHHPSYQVAVGGRGVGIFHDPVHMREISEPIRKSNSEFRALLLGMPEAEFSVAPDPDRATLPDMTQGLSLELASRILRGDKITRELTAKLEQELYRGANTTTAMFQAHDLARDMAPNFETVRKTSRQEAGAALSKALERINAGDKLQQVQEEAAQRFEKQYLRGADDKAIQTKVENKRKTEVVKRSVLSRGDLEDSGLWITDPVEQLDLPEEGLRRPAPAVDDNGELVDEPSAPVTDQDILEVTEIPKSITEYLADVKQALIDKGGVKPGDADFVDAYTRSLVQALRGAINTLTYGRTRQSLNAQVDKLEDLKKLEAIDRRAEKILWKTFQVSAHTSRKDMVATLNKKINQNIKRKGAGSVTTSWTRDSLPKVVVRELKYIKSVISMTPAEVEDAIVRIEDQLENGMSEFNKTSEAERISRDEKIAQLNLHRDLLTTYGALNGYVEGADGKMKPLRTHGQIQEIVDTTLSRIEEAIATQKEALELRATQFKAKRELIAGAVRAAKGRRTKGATAEWLNAVELYPMNLDGRLKDLIRYESSEGKVVLWNKDVLPEGDVWSLASLSRDVSIAQANIRMRKHAVHRQLLDAVRDIYGVKTDVMAQQKISELMKGRKRYAKYSKQENPPALSKSMLMQFIAYMDQVFYHDNATEHGRMADYDAIKAELSQEDLKLIDWMRGFYKEQRPELSAMKEKITGLPFPEDIDPMYMPVGIQRYGGFSGLMSSLQVTPGIYSERRHHRLDIKEEESAGMLSIFFDRNHKNAVYLELAELSMDVQSLFGDKDLQRTIQEIYGEKYLKVFMKKLFDTMSQKPLRIDEDNGSKWVIGYGAWVMTFNVASAVRQPSSMWEYGMDHSLIKVAAWSTNGLNPWMAPYVIDMFRSPQAKARFGAGHSYEIAAAFEAEGIGALKKLVSKYGMILNKGMDLMTIATIGAGVYREYYKHFVNDLDMSEADAKKKAMDWAWAESENHQQSSFVSNQSHWQQSTWVNKAVGMFSSTPQQFLSLHNVAVREARATGNWGPVLRSILIHHVLGPTMYKMIEFAFMSALGRPPEEDELKEWIAMMIIGPYAGMFVGRALWSGMVGVLLDTDNSRYGVELIPAERMMEAVIDTADAAKAFMEGDTERGVKLLTNNLKIIAPVRYGLEIKENYLD